MLFSHVIRESNLLSLASAAANLGKKQINAKRKLLVNEMALQLSDLLAEHVRGITDTTQNTETAGIRDGSSELRAGGDVHASQQDGMLDTEQVSNGSADLLCVVVLAIIYVSRHG